MFINILVSYVDYIVRGFKLININLVSINLVIPKPMSYLALPEIRDFTLKFIIYVNRKSFII